MFSAILFDLDNTLIDRDAAFNQLLRSSFADPSEISLLAEIDDSGYGNRDSLFLNWKRLTGQAMCMATFGSQLASYVRPNPLLLQSLGQLAKMTTIGIITNGGVQTQTAKWLAAGLNTIVPRERLWISEELGIAKPNPAIFRLTCEQLGFRASECLYVGDQIAIDIEGAKAANLKTRLATKPLTGQQIMRDFIAEYSFES